MRQHSEQLAQVLTGGSFTRRLIADVFHGTERIEQDVPITDWHIDGDLLAEVKQSGGGTIVHQSVAGESWKPVGGVGLLSPFQARLLLLMEISAGGFSETITLGWFKITEVPFSRDTYAIVNGQRVVVTSTVEVVFESLDRGLKDWGFRSEQQPTSLTSVYSEIRRVSGMAVLETVEDRAIPSAFTYETGAGGHLKGVQTLAGLLGGRAVINPLGAVTVVPYAMGDVVGELAIGASGTILATIYSIKTDGVFNCIVGNFETADRTPIYSVAEITTGPLAVSNGERTGWIGPSETVRNQEQADAATQAKLTLSSGSQNYDVPVQCIVNPLFELGDALKLTTDDGVTVGQAIKYSLSDSPLMNVTIRASRPL